MGKLAEIFRSYDTRLSTKDESAYNAWVARQSRIAGRDLSRDTADYDLRGLYLSVAGKDLSAGHGTDRFKKPNHPTFSDESIYHSAERPGGTWGMEGKQPVFYASPYNLKNTSPEALQRYFAEREPGVKLILPR